MRLPYTQFCEGCRYEQEICKTRRLPFIIEMECCYLIAEKHWQNLRQQIRTYSFIDTAEEIHFFKTIKPFFVAEQEYYRFLMYSCKFFPGNDNPTFHQIFWRRQQGLLNKFGKKHAIFYDYYRSGRDCMDAVYYTRHLSGMEEFSFDRTASGYDVLTGQLIAHERYYDYAGQQLQIFIARKKEWALKK